RAATGRDRRHRLRPAEGGLVQRQRGRPVRAARPRADRLTVAKATTAGFGARIAAAYATKGDAIRLGTGVHEDELDAEAVVQVPLRMLNRHGLIAGATGTGKTRTLQLIA